VRFNQLLASAVRESGVKKRVYSLAVAFFLDYHFLCSLGEFQKGMNHIGTLRVELFFKDSVAAKVPPCKLRPESKSQEEGGTSHSKPRKKEKGKKKVKSKRTKSKNRIPTRRTKPDERASICYFWISKTSSRTPKPHRTKKENKNKVSFRAFPSADLSLFFFLV
jgi:hypothetical protein